MQVILKEDVENLGRIGDVVKVSDGYARNFLIPNKLVAFASVTNMAQVEHEKKMLEKKKLLQKSSAEELSKKISSQSVTLTKKVGENDKIFGSVTSQDIADELKKLGFDVEKKQIVLQDPIKALGVFSVTVKLQPEVSAAVKVWVVKEQA